MTKKIVLAALTAIVLVVAGFGAPSAARDNNPVRILFIGNSLTFWNDLPAMLAAIAAAGVAKSPVIKTAVHATRTAFVAFVVPFMFVYRPALLTLGTWEEILYAIFFAVVGVFVLSAALEGYALRKLTLIERTLALAAGLALVVPTSTLDFIGLGLIVMLAGVQLLGKRKAA